MTPALREKMFDRISIGGFDACWWWKGARTSLGYGTITVEGKTVRAHRFVYEHFRGPIPEGHQLHHTCEERSCVNPKHLAPVSSQVEHMRIHGYAAAQAIGAKLAARTHCKNGHEFTEENTRIQMRKGRWQRACRLCGRDRNRAARAKYDEPPTHTSDCGDRSGDCTCGATRSDGTPWSMDEPPTGEGAARLECQHEGCTRLPKWKDAWGEWCDEHNGGRADEPPTEQDDPSKRFPEDVPR